jgi:hypothetical protein
MRELLEVGYQNLNEQVGQLINKLRGQASPTRAARVV